MKCDAFKRILKDPKLKFLRLWIDLKDADLGDNYDRIRSYQDVD